MESDPDATPEMVNVFCSQFASARALIQSGRILHEVVRIEKCRARKSGLGLFV